MTTASASTEARVSYQLFQSSRMRPRSKARLALRKIPLSKGRASATKNAMLRLVARVLIARQHGLCRAGVEAITIRTRIGKGRLSPRSALAGENVIVLTQNSSVRNKRRVHLVLVAARILVA